MNEPANVVFARETCAHSREVRTCAGRSLNASFGWRRERRAERARGLRRQWGFVPRARCDWVSRDEVFRQKMTLRSDVTLRPK